MSKQKEYDGTIGEAVNDDHEERISRISRYLASMFPSWEADQRYVIASGLFHASENTQFCSECQYSTSADYSHD